MINNKKLTSIKIVICSLVMITSQAAAGWGGNSVTLRKWDDGSLCQYKGNCGVNAGQDKCCCTDGSHEWWLGEKNVRHVGKCAQYWGVAINLANS